MSMMYMYILYRWMRVFTIWMAIYLHQSAIPDRLLDLPENHIGNDSN